MLLVPGGVYGCPVVSFVHAGGRIDAVAIEVGTSLTEAVRRKRIPGSEGSVSGARVPGCVTSSSTSGPRTASVWRRRVGRTARPEGPGREGLRVGERPRDSHHQVPVKDLASDGRRGS